MFNGRRHVQDAVHQFLQPGLAIVKPVSKLNAASLNPT
jgi:hypothetical protein